MSKGSPVVSRAGAIYYNCFDTHQHLTMLQLCIVSNGFLGCYRVHHGDDWKRARASAVTRRRLAFIRVTYHCVPICLL